MFVAGIGPLRSGYFLFGNNRRATGVLLVARLQAEGAAYGMAQGSTEMMTGPAARMISSGAGIGCSPSGDHPSRRRIDST